jgi:ribosome biogenesis protein MAK21
MRNSEHTRTQSNSSPARIMGKKRHRPAKDPELVSSAATLPSFDERALSALTDKIESGFRNKAGSKADSLDRNRPPGKTFGNRIEKPHHVSGRKRDAQGNVREQRSHGSKIPRMGTDGPNGKNQDEKNVLFQEILALGGTQEDLDLVMEVVTDDDDIGDTGQEQTSAIDPKLTKELSNFIAGLGIETQANEDSSGVESSVDEDEDEEGIPDQATINPTPTKAVKGAETSALRNAKSSAKGRKDLVSKSLPLIRQCCTDKSI